MEDKETYKLGHNKRLSVKESQRGDYNERGMRGEARWLYTSRHLANATPCVPSHESRTCTLICSLVAVRHAGYILNACTQPQCMSLAPTHVNRVHIHRSRSSLSIYAQVFDLKLAANLRTIQRTDPIPNKESALEQSVHTGGRQRANPRAGNSRDIKADLSRFFCGISEQIVEIYWKQDGLKEIA